MRKFSSRPTKSIPKFRPTERGGVRAVLLGGVCFALGLGAGAWWFHRPVEAVEPAVAQDTANANAASPPVAAPAPVDSPQPAARTPGRSRVPPPPPGPASPEVIESVKQVIPNPAAVTLEDGKKMLRIAALDEFAKASLDMANQIKAAQQRLADARNGGSEAGQQAAMKELQQLQSSQTAKLQEIAARNQAQLDALQQMKAAAR